MDIGFVAEAVVAAFLVAFGAVFGSFLNVLAHRLPRGESVVFVASHCTACGARVRPRDNVPVLGWLLLRGRCRDCGAHISARYPLVEAASAAVVGLVGSVELLSGGRSLPASSPGSFSGVRRGIDLLLFHPEWWLFGTCLLHVAVLVTLLSWALLARGGHPVPRLWFRGTVLLAIGAALLWPGLLPIGLQHPFGQRGGPQEWQAALAVAVVGTALGWLTGSLLGRPVIRDGLSLLGAALGWQAVVQTTLLLLLLSVPAAGAVVARAIAAGAGGGNDGERPTGSQAVASSGWALLVAAVILVVLWRWIDAGTAALWQALAPPWGGG